MFAALGGGWTATALLEAIEALLKVVGAHVTAGAVESALGKLGFAESEAMSLESALKTPVIDAFAGGWDYAAQSVSQVPEDSLREGALADTLARLGIDLKGVSAVSVNRIGDELAQAISEGQPSSVAAERIDAILHDRKRAQVIARTEIARAMEGALLAQGKAMGGMEKSWLDAPDACPICQENAAEGPIAINKDFKGGAPSPPQHPNCRCALALEPAAVI